MDKALVPVRDLTDSDQNQAVLDVASALAGGRAAAGRVAGSHAPAVAAEAIAAARSRRRLGELIGPIHLAQHYGPQDLAVEPIVFTEDFAATNFPSVEPGRAT